MQKLFTAVGALAIVTSMNVSTAEAQDGFMGEMMVTAANFCPRGWLAADGQLLPIEQYQALFSLLGTTYGGDGRTTFKLPDMRGRAAIGEGKGDQLQEKRLGSPGGVEYVTLNPSHIPAHTHQLPAQDARSANAESNETEMAVRASPKSGDETTVATMPTGANQPFLAQGPYLTLTWCINTYGMYPSRN